jgi:hypothetical protein
MDKGIRTGVKGKFNEMLPQLAALGGKAFRRTILDWTVENFGCTMAAASTHYNFAKHEATKADATLVAGLGRAPEKNNGGRKKKVEIEFVGPVAPIEGTLISEGVKENTSTHTITTNPVEETPAAPVLFTVKRAKDGAVIAEGLSQEAADALVAKAAAQKKAKLVIA